MGKECSIYLLFITDIKKEDPSVLAWPWAFPHWTVRRGSLDFSPQMFFFFVFWKKKRKHAESIQAHLSAAQSFTSCYTRTSAWSWRALRPPQNAALATSQLTSRQIKKERSGSSSNQTSIYMHYVNWRLRSTATLVCAGSRPAATTSEISHTLICELNLLFRVITPLYSPVSSIIPWADTPHRPSKGSPSF